MRPAQLIQSGRATERASRLGLWQRRSTKRRVGFLVAYYLLLAQLAVLPAAIESGELPGVDETSPYSVTDLVEYLDQRDAAHSARGDATDGRAEQASTAGSASAAPVGTEGAVTDAQLADAAAQAVSEWQAAVPDADLSGVTVTAADLPELTLGASSGTTITIDVDAAGHGWDVAYAAEEASARMHLLTVVRHEIGHVLGHAHEAGTLMTSTLWPGEIWTVDSVVTSTSDTTTSDTTTSDTTTSDTTTTDTSPSDTSPSDTSAPETSTSDTTTTDTSTADTAGTSTTGTSTTGTPTTDTSATDTATTADAPAVDTSTGWSVLDGVATWTTDGPLAHTLVLDDGTGGLALVDAAGAVDTLDLTGVTSVVVHGSAGDDRVTLDGAAALPVALHLGDGTDELVGPTTDQQWVIDGPDAGVVAGVAFTGAENVTGNVDNQDEFVVEATGSITGQVAGGDGGFDTVTIGDGDFDTVHYTITGHDSGTIERDGDLLVYEGMEPVNTGSSTNQVYTATTSADTITIVDIGTSTDGDIEIQFSSGENHTVNLSGITSIEIRGDLGGDSFVISSYDDALSDVTLNFVGGDGGDTFSIAADVAGSWTLDSVGGGSWEAGDVVVGFSAVEHLIGASSADETYDFQPGGTVTGSITDGSGQLTVRLGGFGSVTGDFIFGTTTYSGQDTAAGTITNADVITVTGTNGAVFYGLEIGTAQVGVSGTAGNWGIAVVTDGTNVWQAWEGTFSNPSITGIGELDLDVSSFAIEMNTAAANGEAIDFSGAGALDLGTVTLDLGVASTAVSALGARLELAEFIWIEGDLSLQLGADRDVTIDTASLTDPAAVQTAVDDSNAGVSPGDEVLFSGGSLTNVPVSTVTLGLTGADVFVGNNPLGFALFDSDSLDWDSTGANGVVALGLSLGFVFAQIRREELQSLFGDFLAVEGEVASLDLVGLTDALQLTIQGGELSYNRSNELDGQTGSSAWIDWAASFPGTPDGLQLTVPGSSDTLVFDASDPVLAVSATSALLTVSKFLAIRGSFAFELGAVRSVTIETANLGAEESAFYAAVDDPLTGLSRTDGTISGFDVTTSLIGFGGAVVFAGYNPDAFDVATAFDCTTLTDAYGLCANGINVGIAMASLVDPDLISDYRMPSFLGARVDIASLVPLGIPTDLFELSFVNISIALNRGGEISTWDGTTATPITGSSSWIDWTASFPDLDGVGGTPAGLPVPTGSGTQYIDLEDPITGIAADLVTLKIGPPGASTFVYVTGGFAFEQGNLEDLVIRTIGLTPTELTDLQTGLTGNASMTGDTITVTGVPTSSLGISDASVFVGYAPVEFETSDGRFTSAPDGSFGLLATGINVGLVMAKVDPSYVPTGYTLPNLFGLRASVTSMTFPGLPTSIFDFYIEDIELVVNKRGVIGGTGVGVDAATAHIDWLATAQESDPSALGVEVSTGTTTPSVLVDMEDPVTGVSAGLVVLRVSDYVHVSGSFSFLQGVIEPLQLQTTGLSSTDITSLGTALTNGGTGAAIDAEGLITGLQAQLTLIGVADATVFVGFAAAGLPDEATFSCSDPTLDGAFGLCVSNIDVGFASATPIAGTLPSTSTWALPTLTSFKAWIGEIALLGLPTFIDFRLQGAEVTVNNAGPITNSNVVVGEAFVQWASSFPDTDGEETGDPAGLAVPTGGDPVFLDEDTTVVGVAAKLVLLSISDFVHISGSFSLRAGQFAEVDIDVVGTGGLTEYAAVDVNLTTIGIGDASLFVGYNPGPDGLAASFDTGSDDILDEEDLDSEALGLLLTDVDLGIALAEVLTDQNGSYTLQGGLPTFGNFLAVKGSVGAFALVNLLPSFINLTLEDIEAFANGTASATGAATGDATIDWISTYGSTGLAVPTGPSTDPNPVNLDFSGPVIGVAAGLAIISISDFVHISGGFAFSKGGTLVADINTSTAITTPFAFIPIAADKDDAGGSLARSSDSSVLWNVDISTLQLGINDASVFVGYNPAPSGGTIADLMGADDILSSDELSADAIGLFASNVDFGLVLSTILPTLAMRGLGELPRFTTVKASMDELSVIGLDEFFTFFMRYARVEVNTGSRWAFDASAVTPPTIDWTTQTYNHDDDLTTPEVEGLATPEVEGGYGVATGPGNPPVVFTMDGYLIGGGVDLLVIGIGEFIHLRGAAYFEQGRTLTVPLAQVIDLTDFTGLLPQSVLDLAGVEDKELQFLNIGAQDVYAFVGIGGPHWLTESDDPSDPTVDDGRSDLINDLQMECDPTSSTCVPADCDYDGTNDGITEADADDRDCVLVINETAIGIAVSNLDFAFAMGTPTNQLDPTRYYTVRATLDEATLIGLEDAGLTAELIGVSFELNIATPTVSGFPVLPAIDWEQYARDNGCTDQDVADFNDGLVITNSGCEPFGVKTGRIVGDVEVTQDFFYDGLYVRAAVRLARLDVFGVLAARGSLAFVLGPVVSGTLTNGDPFSGVTTMTIGGANLYGFIGVSGPHWVEDADGNLVGHLDTDGDGDADGGPCNPDTYDGPDECIPDRDSAAIGLALTDLDFGIFVGASLDPSSPAAFVAADISLPQAGLELVGVPGVTAQAMLAISLNLGFALGASGGSFSGINFRDSFRYDSNGDGTDDTDGYALDTGDPSNPIVLDFHETFIEVQLTGSVEIRAGPTPIARIDGIFYLGIDLDAGTTEFRLLALGEMTIGPDSSGSGDPILSIGALGVLILNGAGIAGDFTVNADLNIPLISLEMTARLIFNTTGTDQVLVLPERLETYLRSLGNDAAADIVNLGDLASQLLSRVDGCDDAPSAGTPCVYTISGTAPNLVNSTGGQTGADTDTIRHLLGNESATLTLGTTGPYVVVVLRGTLSVAGFASATGLAAVQIGAGGFELVVDVTFNLGPAANVSLNVGVRAVVELTASGFYLLANVGIDANLLGLFDLDVTGEIEINTNPGNEIFKLHLPHGSISLLGVVTFDADVLIYVGGALGEDAWYFGGSLSTDFGPLDFSASAFITSWGSFGVTGTAGIDITIAGTGIEGDLTGHVSYCAHATSGGVPTQTCHDDLRTYINPDGSLNLPTGDIAGLGGVTFREYIDSLKNTDPVDGVAAAGRTFLVEVSGSVEVKVFGLTLLGVGANAKLYGVLGQRITLTVTVTVDTIFGDIEEDINFGTFYIPNALVNNDIDPDLATKDESTGVLTLNVGDLADQRQVAQSDTQEWYTITQVGGTTTVSAFGYTETFTGVTSIVGDFGTDLDKLTIGAGVTAPLDVQMGSGNDEVVHDGAGAGTFDGGDDDDYIRIGSAGSTVTGGDGDDELLGGSGVDTINGGLGDDLIDGGLGVDTLIGGPATVSGLETDDDVFRGSAAALAGESLDPGAGYDRLEVWGLETGETLSVAIISSVLTLTYPVGPIGIDGINTLSVLLQGGDTFTIEGSVRADAPTSDSLEVVESVFADVTGSADATVLTLTAQDDAASVRRVGGTVDRTIVSWDGLELDLIGSSLATGDRDTLTIQSLGGNDGVAITGTRIDTTVELGEGADTVVVGSAALCPTGTSCTNTGGTVDAVDAPVTVNGGNGTDTLDIDDTGDDTGDTGAGPDGALRITHSLVTGVGLHAKGITYTVDVLDVHLGSGGDAIEVWSTSATTTTTIEGNDGIDVFDVSSDAPTNAGDLDGVAGDLILDGGLKADVANLSDDGDSSGDTGTLTETTLSSGFTGGGTITYLDLATFNLDLGAGHDRLTVESVHGGTTTIDLGAGNDALSLQTSPNGSVLTIHGEGGDDLFEFGSLSVASDEDIGTGIPTGVVAIATDGVVDGIDGDVTVIGDAPDLSDWLYLDDTGSTGPRSGDITSSTVEGFGMAGTLTYLAVEHLIIALGDQVDTVDVTSTNGATDTPVSTTETTLHLGGGDDLVNVSSNASTNTGLLDTILGHLIINGEAGVDTVNLSDWGDEWDNTGYLTSTDVTGLGMGPDGVTYGTLEYLNIDLGTGNDEFTIASTHKGETTLDTRAGNDLVDVGDDADVVDGRVINGVDGFLDIDLGDGTDDRLEINAQNSAVETVGRVTSTEITGLDTEIDPTLAPRDLTSDRVDIVTIIDGSHGTVALTWADSGQTMPIEFALNADVATIRAAIATGLSVTLESVLVSRTSLLRQDGTTFRITFAGLLAGAGGHNLGQLTVDIDCDPTDLADTGCVIGFADTGGVVGKEVVTSTTGRIEYTNTEYLDVHLGKEAEYLELLQTGAITTINSREGADVVDVEIVDHETWIVGGAGRDTIQVNVFPNAPDTNDINELLHLDGEQGEDTIFIQLSSQLLQDSFIEAFDSGTDEGVDDLVVQGSQVNDQFLLRSYFVALLNNFDTTLEQYTNAEFVHYDDGIENLIINTLDGADSVAFDDTNVATTVNLGHGEDFIQVGQLFGDECLGEPLAEFVPDQGPGELRVDDQGCFDNRFVPPFLIDSTQGMLSNGISESTTINGGAGNDLMIVFRNRAVLTLNGESGDDTFVIRTFLEEDSETQLDAGEGTDVISYIMNAPVNVNGGDGYDRLYIIGTEADDVFVITEDGVYGAGRFISFWAIELLGIDAVEGNDRIYVQSTAPGVAVEVYGGLGSDTIEIGSNLVPTIVEADGTEFYRPILAAADDLIGHSGLIVHTTPDDTVTIDGIAAEIVDDDEPAVLITQTGGITVVAEDDGSTDFAAYEIDTYTVVLTSAPTTQVLVEALTAILTPEQINGASGPAYNVQLSLDARVLTDADGFDDVTGESLWSTRGVNLYFDAFNWNVAQTVYVRAFDDNAPEGDNLTAIRHTVGAFQAGVVGSATSSTITSADLAGLADIAGKQLIVEFADENRVYTIESFDASTNTLTIEGLFDDGIPTMGTHFEIRGLGAFGEIVLNDLFVRVIDNDVDEVVVIEAGVDTTVAEHGGIVDSYQLGRTGDATTALTVDLVVPDGLCVSLSATDASTCLTFVELLGGELVTLWVHAVDDTIREGFQYSTIVHTTDVDPDNPVVGRLLVGTIDDEHQTVQVVETDGSTVVTEGDFDAAGEPTTAITDTYTVFLSAPLTGTETFTLNATAIETKTQYDAGDQIGLIDECLSHDIVGDRITCNEIQLELRYRPAGSTDPADWSVWATTHPLVFDADNWDTGFEVEVRAINDTFIDGRILQAFPEAPARVNRIQGALYVDGGPSAFGYPLANFTPVMLPGEASSKLTITPNPAFDVIEDNAVDTLVVRNEDDVAASWLELTTATAIPNQPSEEFLAYLGELGATPEQPTQDELDNGVSRYALLGLGMGALGIQYDELEVLDIWLGSGADDVTVTTTHTGTTTIRGHEGDDEFWIEEILGHTRILGGVDDDTVTVSDELQTLESLDAQLLVSGEEGDDTAIVDDSGDAADDDQGTLTQTSLVGLDMDSTTPDDMFSLELSGDVYALTVSIFAYRPADLENDDPGVLIGDRVADGSGGWIEVPLTFTIDADAVNALADLGALPYGDYSAYGGTGPGDTPATDLSGLDDYLLAGLIQHALFPHQEPTEAYVENPDGSRTYTHANGDSDDDRFPTTGCGLAGTTDERDSRCANSVYVWASGTRVGEDAVRVFLIGFQGELAGIHVTFEVVPEDASGTPTGTYATDLQRTDGITYDTLEVLDIRLGSGNDLFNVRGTLPHTLLDTGGGDDVVFVSDAAGLYAHTRPNVSGPEGLESALADAADLEELHRRTLHGTVHYDDRTYDGTLDEIDGDLDIDTGAGSNTLAVSDHASPNADTGFTISHDTITGLADGTITYDSSHDTTGGDLAGQGYWPRQADAGMFGRGITIHLGTGDDVGTIASVRGHTLSAPLQLTVTTVYGNDGNDRLTVDAPDVRDTDGTLLARLVVYGDNGNDTIDGTDADLPLIVFGEDGNDDIQGGTDDDVLFGDDGRVVLYRDAGSDTGGDIWDVWLGGTKVALPSSVDPGTSTLGSAFTPDTVFETLDVLYTVFLDEAGRDDVVRGGAGDDVVIGGVGDDGLDGEADRDLVIGDRAILTRNEAMTSPIVRALDGETLVVVDPLGSTTLGAVDDTHQSDPHGDWPWTITLLDHLSGLSLDGPTPAVRYGDDVAAGGSGEDVVFGQLGDDLLHGDGVLNAAGDAFLDVTLVDTTTDGDDYVEGNGGADIILGGLGQDDLLGGSSDLFGLVTRAMRPDGIDRIHGGNGDAAGRNDDGRTGADALSRDADVLLGDNGRIFRLVGTNGSSTGEFLTFTHDLGCATAECIIPRQVELLDYSPVGERFLLAVTDPATPAWNEAIGDANIGDGDFLHGEASNDIIWGATGQDAIFGDAGDDDLYGGTNRDWISGGTGIDGIIADHGIILTNRHGSGEALYGITALPNVELDKIIDTPGDLQTALINETGVLHKSVELDLAIPGVTSFSTFYVGDHDIAYGGLGDDFIHGGEGDDMLSGAEALGLYYTDDPWATLQGIYGAIVDHDAGILQHGVVRAGEFRCYDEFNPLALVEVCDADATPDGSDIPYLTNNDAAEDDGADVLFGDGGDDWIVGGVNHDRAFGGWGDDLLDMDDDKTTSSGLNDAPDIATWVTYADIAYGGAGRDVLIANTGADRLIDWVGEYNSYIVPFSPYGAFTISRSLAPHLFQYLYELSEAEGADVTRGGDVTRNGEPRGELGLVTQQDDAWQAQTGAPDDPQAGNTQGPRDVLREEDFSSASSATTAFAVESGSWSVVNGRYESVASLDSDAISIFYVDEVLPHQFEIIAIVNADKNKGGFNSNAYIIFDYQGPNDFKFAGLEMGTDKVEIGRRTANGWEVLASFNLQTHHNTNYHLRLWIDGQVVTLFVDGVRRVSHDYGSPLLVAGEPSTALDPLTDGYVGIGSNGSVSRAEYMAVQVLAPEITFSLTDEFVVAPSHATSGGTWSVDGGRWTVAPASGEVGLSLTFLTIAPSALLVLDTTVTTDGIAGVAFDVVSADRFKFAVLDTTTGRLLFGHYASGSWVVEAWIAVAVGAGTPHTLTVHMNGTTATAVVDGVVIAAHSWHSLLNDGGLGLLATGGMASFGHLALSTDDPALEPAEPFVSVADAEVIEGDDGTTTLNVMVSLSRTTDRDVTVSWSTANGTATDGSDYVTATGTATILAGELSTTVVVSITSDTTIELDETFFLGLSSPDGAIIGDGTALLTIRNDDVDVVVDVAAADTSAAEAGSDAAVFELTRTGATDGTLDVRLSWQGTAGFAVDYTVTVAGGGTLSHDGSVLTFDTGVSVVTLTVTPLTDDLAEPTETIQLHVLADEDYGVGTATASADLADDAALPTLSISDAVALEGDRGGTWVELTVTLGTASPTDVTVTYRTHEGTASANDFRTESGTVTFAAGVTVQVIRIRVYADRTAELDETFTVELTDPVNAVIADGIGVVTILDDEGGRLTATTTGAGGAPLPPSVLTDALDAAVAWWAAQGADVTGLAGVAVRLVDLPGRTLAIQTTSGLLLDVDAAGHGWGSTGMDLATVLRHELGHALGHGHDDAHGSVMQAVLLPGEAWPAAPTATSVLDPATSTSVLASVTSPTARVDASGLSRHGIASLTTTVPSGVSPATTAVLSVMPATTTALSVAPAGVRVERTSILGSVELPEVGPWIDQLRVVPAVPARHGNVVVWFLALAVLLLIVPQGSHGGRPLRRGTVR